MPLTIRRCLRRHVWSHTQRLDQELALFAEGSLGLAACFCTILAESIGQGHEIARIPVGGQQSVFFRTRPRRRKNTEILACQGWNPRMLGFRGPAQPSSPPWETPLNAGYRYLDVKCLGCDTHQTVPLDIVRRPKTFTSTSWSATCASGSAPSARDGQSAAIWWPWPRQPPHGNHKPGNESCLQILNLEDCNAIRCVRG